MHDHHRHAHPSTQRFPPPPEGIVGLVRHELLDPALAATAWLLVERGCPIVIADPGTPVRRGRILESFLEAVPPSWLRVAATDLEPGDVLAEGRERPRVYADGGELGTAPVNLAFGPGAPSGVAGGPTSSRAGGTPGPLSPNPRLRTHDFGRIRAVAGAISLLDRGLGLGVAVEADSLEGVLAFFRNPALRIAEDRLSFLGLVLVVGEASAAVPGGAAAVVPGGATAPQPTGSGARQTARIVAAHYLRPIAKDAGGHVQRFGPAVLATWDAETDRWEDFSWGVAADLAERVGLPPAVFEAERDRRATVLEALAR